MQFFIFHFLRNLEFIFEAISPGIQSSFKPYSDCISEIFKCKCSVRTLSSAVPTLLYVDSQNLDFLFSASPSEYIFHSPFFISLSCPFISYFERKKNAKNVRFFFPSLCNRTWKIIVNLYFINFTHSHVKVECTNFMVTHIFAFYYMQWKLLDSIIKILNEHQVFLSFFYLLANGNYLIDKLSIWDHHDRCITYWIAYIVFYCDMAAEWDKSCVTNERNIRLKVNVTEIANTEARPMIFTASSGCPPRLGSSINDSRRISLAECHNHSHRFFFSPQNRIKSFHSISLPINSYDFMDILDLMNF